MTKEEFIAKVNKYKDQASELIEGDGGFQVHRGMAHVISGYVEDLFALFIATSVNDPEREYFVDKVTSIRFKEGEKAKSFKPDLSVIKEKVLTNYFDIKTSMGWNRHFEEYLKEKSDFIEKLKGKNSWIHWEGESIPIKIASDLKYEMVVVYGWNINRELLADNLKKASKIKNVAVHILYKEKDDQSGYELNENAFDQILQSVKR